MMKIQGGDALLAGQKNRKPRVWIAIIATHHSHYSLLRKHIPPGIPNGESIAKMFRKFFQQTRAEQQIHLRQKCEALFQVPPLAKDLQIFRPRFGATRISSKARTRHIGSWLEVGTAASRRDHQKRLLRKHAGIS